MIRRLLIANRGEIACRIMRTARAMGIHTIAVYSEADATAQHVQQADEAWLLGPAPARESYLNIHRLLEIARESRADAIHPGYGFLSENEGFAEAVTQAGIRFIGPPAAAIAAMGDKSASKRHMEQAGVPLVPGYHGEEQQTETLQKAADAIGYPVLIKASSGGGGKGMKVVDNAASFADQLASAQREALASFGDSRVLVEKYLQQPRHIEIQIFADQQGNTVYLFERDCSVQRRHQKVLEEAPAPGLDASTRQAMGEAAVAAAKAVGYVGAGTVEFIYDTRAGQFYFMEMNTRLQVEHPVTELITGLDLVAWQLRIANGEPLPRQQSELQAEGHAIEVRLYAEDPANDFLPATGPIRHLRWPAENNHVRIDSGVISGDTISPWYDPMIAKIIVWDRDRQSAFLRLQHALAQVELVGLTSNLDFLRNLAAHPAVCEQQPDTGLIARHYGELVPDEQALPDLTILLAALAELAREQQLLRKQPADPHSPWQTLDGWRLNSTLRQTLLMADRNRDYSVTVEYVDSQHYVLLLNQQRYHASAEVDPSGQLLARIDGRQCRARVVDHGEWINLLWAGGSAALRRRHPWQESEDNARHDGRIVSPMPGTITRLLVSEGQPVNAGDALLTLEAMKMEHTLTAPADGQVGALYISQGEQVQAESLLVEIHLKQDNT